MRHPHNLFMELTCHFNKVKPHPGDILRVYFTLRNKDESKILIRNVSLSSSWISTPLDKEIRRVLEPPSRIWLWDNYDNWTFDFSLEIPKYIIGKHHLNLCVSYVFMQENGQWGYLRHWNSNWVINISVEPRYRAFISRTIRPQESEVPDAISDVFQRWNFEIQTVGKEIELKGRPLEQVIGESITITDIIFAIATKRDQLQNRLGWRTLEYLQGEVGYSYAKDKPIIVFVEEGVDLGGLASCFKPIVFNPRKLKQFKHWLNDSLYEIREWLRTWKRRKFWDNFSEGLITKGIPLTIMFISGFAIGKMLKDNHSEQLTST